MQRISKWFVSGLATAGLYLMSAGGIYDSLVEQMTGLPEPERMKNVSLVSDGEFREEKLRAFSADTATDAKTDKGAEPEQTEAVNAAEDPEEPSAHPFSKLT